MTGDNILDFLSSDQSGINKSTRRKRKEQYASSQNRDSNPANEDVGLVVDWRDPVRTARMFISTCYEFDGVQTLRFRDGEFYAWSGSRYCAVENMKVRSAVYAFLGKAVAKTENGFVPYKPAKKQVDEVIDALKASCHFDNNQPIPCWITAENELNPSDIIAFRNGLLYLPTRELFNATPRFFNTNCLTFDYDSIAADAPNWKRFLNEIWGDDRVSIETLQEWFGYLLTSNTAQQKILMIIGPKRAGKGTIARVLNALIGCENVCGPTLFGLTKDFGIQALIGKLVAIVADARLSSRADQHIIAERLLSISGEDVITIDRKYREPWTGRLSARFILMSNELPRLADASGALSSRFIVLSLQRSFYGNEDKQLEQKLLAELPAILNWALDGLDRLLERGCFLQPDQGQEILDELDDLVSPIGAFVRDCCEVNLNFSVPPNELFAAWKQWCKEQGWEHAGTLQNFGKEIRAAVPSIRSVRPRNGGVNDSVRQRLYRGIKVRS